MIRWRYLAVVAAVVGGLGLGSAAAGAARVWQRVSPVPVRRLGLAAVGNGRFVYAIGGWNRTAKALASVERFDSVTGRWRAEAPMPLRLFGIAAARGLDGRLFVFGGRGPAVPDSLDHTLIYTPQTDTWTRGAQMPTPRYWAAATSGINGAVYVIGGSNFTGRGAAGVGTVEAYIPKTDRWHTEPSLPITDNGDYSMLAAVTGRAGRIYVLGGFDPHHGTARATVWAWWPGQTRWHARARMPIPLFGLAAVRASDGHIIAMGGSSGATINGRYVVSRAVEAYDPSRNTWRLLPSMPTARANLAVATAGVRIYAIGGTPTRIYDGLRTVEALQP